MFDKKQMNKFYKYCLSLTSDEQKAFDLLHNSLEKFLRYSINPTALNSYIYKIVKNEFINICIKQNKQNASAFEEESSDVVHLNTDFEGIQIDKNQIETLMNRLKPEEREILYLWAYEGYTYEEMGEILEISKGTLLSKVHRIKKKILKDLAEEGIG
jgi:RNA polymerase sigma-70 factor (ECF subfamily)